MGNPGWPSLTCNKAEVFRAMNWSETDSEHVQWFLNMKHGGQRAWEQIYNSLSPQERMADRSSRPSSKLGRAQYDQAAADALLSNVSRNEKHILQASTPLLAYMLYHGRREYNRTNRAKEQTWADRQALLSSALLSSSTAKPPSRRFRPPSASATQILAPRSRPTRSGFDQVYSPQPERLAELSQIEDYANDLACACTRASTSDTVTMDCTAAGEPMFGGLNPNTRPAALRNEGGWSDLRPPALATMNSSSKRSLANYSVICWHCRSPNVVDSLAIMGKPPSSYPALPVDPDVHSSNHAATTLASSVSCSLLPADVDWPTGALIDPLPAAPEALDAAASVNLESFKDFNVRSLVNASTPKSPETWDAASVNLDIFDDSDFDTLVTASAFESRPVHT